MKPSPFSDLKLTASVDEPAIGPDQRLFAPTRTSEQSTIPELANRTSAPSLPRASEPPPERTLARDNGSDPVPSYEQSNERTSENSQQATPARALQRSVGRHSHDIFQDQIRWMNRLKLELSERHDVPVTGNAMVQLAVDMLREDYVRKGEQSRLIRVLIDGNPWPAQTASTRAERGEEGSV